MIPSGRGTDVCRELQVPETIGTEIYITMPCSFPCPLKLLMFRYSLASAEGQSDLTGNMETEPSCTWK